MCGALLPPDIPDTGGACCIGAAVNGPAFCTCWEPGYDLAQNPVLTPGVPMPAVPVRMCHDCAYRPGSPERSGDPRVSGDADSLEELVWSGDPFWCHQGIRRQVRLTHPAGAVYDCGPGAYDPPIAGNMPYKADGTPANLCAGWLLRRAAALRQIEREREAACA